MARRSLRLPSAALLQTTVRSKPEGSPRSYWVSGALVVLGIIAFVVLTTVLIKCSHHFWAVEEPVQASASKWNVIKDEISLIAAKKITNQNQMSEIRPQKYPTINDHSTQIHHTTNSSFLPTGQLSSPVKPYLYELSIKAYLLAFPHLNFGLLNDSIYGSVIIYFHCHEATSIIQLNAENLFFRGDKTVLKRLGKTREDDHVLDIKDPTFSNATSIYIIEAESPLVPSHDYSLSISYHAYTSLSGSTGMFKVEYKPDPDSFKHYMMATQLQMEHARQLFPCFDQPNMKAEILLSIEHPIGTHVVSNAPARSRKPSSADFEITTFFKTPKMSTYLLAIFISDFPYKEIYYNNVKIRMYAEPLKINHVRHALESAKKILHFYEKYFNITYPLPKLDIFALPRLKVIAMENWGAIALRSERGIYDPEVHSPEIKNNVFSTLAHEIAHMWFGNLVTMDRWLDIWLNEGFASMMAFRTMESVGTSKALSDGLYFSELQGKCLYVDQDVLKTHPIKPKEDVVFNVANYQLRILYLKTAIILFMTEEVIGADIYRETINIFLENYAYRNVRNEHLFDTMEDTLAKRNKNHTLPPGISMSNFMNSWVLQKGVPVVTVNKLEDGSIHMDQFLFNSRNVNGERTKPEEFIIPVFNFNPTINKHDIIWVIPNTTTNMLPHQYSIPLDPHARGYYRILYSKEIYEEIIKNLKRDHTSISIASRARLIDDAFALAEFGYLSYEIPFTLITYMVRERDYVPFETFEKHLGFLSGYDYNATTASLIAKFALILFEPAYKEINDGIHDEDTSFVKYMYRKLIKTYICHDGNGPCHEENLKKYREIKIACKDLLLSNLKCNSIPEQDRKMVYVSMIKKGSMDDFNFFLSKYHQEYYESERTLMRKAFVFIPRKEELTKYLYNSLIPTNVTGPIISDIRQFVSDLTHSPHPQLIRTFFIDNFDLLYLKYKNIPTHFAYFILYILKYSSTEEKQHQYFLFHQKWKAEFVELHYEAYFSTIQQDYMRKAESRKKYTAKIEAVLNNIIKNM
uniref:Aminopeptidase n=1 Tax=Rhabditophanes sp. KR3021 TaxID=114890 RepID=A0AC35UF27_9BILA